MSEEPRFADRSDAARQLAAQLRFVRGTRPVVAAIPRGGVPMGAVLAEALDADLDVVLVHKVTLPADPEYAVAAVDEAGVVTRYDGVGLSDDALAALARPWVTVLRQRRQAYGQLRPPVDLHGRVVLVVDDGLATGATMLAALRSVRQRGAARVVAVVPVASAEGFAAAQGEADDVVALSVPEDFRAVGDHYARFEPVTDEAVLEALARG
jgi:predicted phosphoribosyltransferase